MPKPEGAEAHDKYGPGEGIEVGFMSVNDADLRLGTRIMELGLSNRLNMDVFTRCSAIGVRSFDN